VPGAWDAETLVDRERLLQIAGGLAGSALASLGVAGINESMRALAKGRQRGHYVRRTDHRRPAGLDSTALLRREVSGRAELKASRLLDVPECESVLFVPLRSNAKTLLMGAPGQRVGGDLAAGADGAAARLEAAAQVTGRNRGQHGSLGGIGAARRAAPSTCSVRHATLCSWGRTGGSGSGTRSAR
jgi:hypothetical protein